MGGYFFGVGLLLFSLGCMAAQTTDCATECESRERAAQALADAQVTVEQAAAARALWLPAQQSMEQALAEFSRGDFAAAERDARAAKDFGALGLRQLEYPPYRYR